jgi:hypothetical protein
MRVRTGMAGAVDCAEHACAPIAPPNHTRHGMGSRLPEERPCVRFGSEADICVEKRHVRFPP